MCVVIRISGVQGALQDLVMGWQTTLGQLFCLALLLRPVLDDGPTEIAPAKIFPKRANLKARVGVLHAPL